jgi:hypothetical protein
MWLLHRASMQCGHQKTTRLKWQRFFASGAHCWCMVSNGMERVNEMQMSCRKQLEFVKDIIILCFVSGRRNLLDVGNSSREKLNKSKNQTH